MIVLSVHFLFVVSSVAFDKLDLSNMDFSSDFSIDYSFDSSDNFLLIPTVHPSCSPTSMPTSMEFSSLYSFNEHEVSLQPSLKPTTRHWTPTYAPSQYEYDTKTEFNFDFSVMLTNISWIEFSASEDMKSAVTETVAEADRNISYHDVTILRVSNRTTAAATDRRSLEGYFHSFSLSNSRAEYRRSLDKTTSIDETIITFRIHGVMERFGRFTENQYSSFYSDLTSLVSSFISSGGFQTSLRIYLQSRGIFRPISIDSSSFTVVSASDIEYTLSKSPTPSPSPAPSTSTKDKKSSPLDRLNFMAMVVLSGALLLVCSLLGAMCYCLCRPKVNRVYVGVGV